MPAKHGTPGLPARLATKHEVCQDCNGLASLSDDLEAECCETCDGLGCVAGEGSK